MTTTTFLSKLESPRRELISSIHEVIISTNKKVKAEVSDMMGKEMIIYKVNNTFTYALSSVKTHMSLHLMPIYGSHELHSKYSKLLNTATFQKGCINFKNAEQMPLTIVKQLLTECSKIDIDAFMERFKKPEVKKEWIAKNKKR